MEKMSQNYDEELTKVEKYIDNFKKRVKEEIKKPDFEPNATQEYDWYDGVNTELSNNLAMIGINKTEIFMWPEQTDELLKECMIDKDIKLLSQDQLYHALIGSTRRPYHNPSTYQLYDDPTQALEVIDVLDWKLLAEVLLKEKNKLEITKKILWYIEDYRSQYKQSKDIKEISEIMNNFIEKLVHLHIHPVINFLPNHQRKYFYDNILPQRKMTNNNLLDEHSIRTYLWQDPVYSTLTLSTPVIWMKKIIDDDRLAKILVEISDETLL
jgi:hypothetical protein